MNTKEYPSWKNALNIIVDAVKSQGYGIIVTHSQMLDYFDMERPEVATPEEWQKFQFEMLANIDRLRTELLLNYNMYLDTVQRKGYQVLKPSDQIKQAPTKHLRNAYKQIRKALLAMTFVDVQQLDVEQERVRMRGLEKLAFLKMQMSKKILAEANIDT